ncbi:hypothetical protein SGFS_049100 [Streptomyces graminofaciens]|uniref:Uncharacterized protein n=1 Tax=Streptomyces graminofaciens TaxID=68212 RepID=A0ABM7FAZ3_9ACTN|nr:hypothetical protein [Streptomyces graminofaciens]BBC33616.1 hypothetical protein SGFS_049100 [Streptomyces graminofaciens]
MSHAPEPRHVLVRPQGGPSPLYLIPYAEQSEALADLDDFTYLVPLDDPELALPEALSEYRPGLEYARALAKHLGAAWVVRYWDERHGTTKFVCWGCDGLHWAAELHPVPPHPVRITMLAEFKWYPLRAEGFGDFAPDDPTAALGLSDDLVAGLYRWAADFDAAMNDYVSARDEDEFDARKRELERVGESLAERLAAELGPGRTVNYLGVV